jgi:peptide deformylase
MYEIWTVEDKKQEKFLRAKTEKFVFSEKGAEVAGKTFTRSQLNQLLKEMHQVMKKADGIGLSANQIGLPYRLFVAEVRGAQGERKFYAVFNPEIEKISSEKSTSEEGCLSIPNLYGEVSRAAQIVLRGLDKNGKPLKIKAWGLLARVFQHEVDHLNGILFIDKTKQLYRVPVSERLKERR